MFTGLVEDCGTVASISSRGNGHALTIASGLPLAEVAIGASIAVNGACLTAEELAGERFTVTCGRETLARTTLGRLRVGDRVHLERALRVGDHLGGHLVQGHVDGVGRVSAVDHDAESWVFWVEVPDDLLRYIAPKGSICIDGVSLTVNELSGRRFRVNVVPHTATVTLMSTRKAGDAVNIEVDILAKYVERLLGGGAGGGLSLETLRRSGFAS